MGLPRRGSVVRRGVSPHYGLCVKRFSLFLLGAGFLGVGLCVCRSLFALTAPREEVSLHVMLNGDGIALPAVIAPRRQALNLAPLVHLARLRYRGRDFQDELLVLRHGTWVVQQDSRIEL